MAVTVTLDLPGSVFVNEFLPGGSYLRRCRVDGLTSPESDTLALIFEALSALPQPNDPLGAPFTGLYVARQRCTGVGCTASTGNKWATAELDYEARDSAYMSAGGGVPNDNGPSVKGIDASLYQREVLNDVDDNPIETVYDGVTQAHRVRGFATQATYTFQRFEATDPQPRLNLYIGRVNVSPFLGYAARQVLCRRIRGEPNAAGANWWVTYAFDARAEVNPWDTEVTHDDPFFPGNPLPSAVGGAGARYTALLHPATDFNFLQLT